MSPEGSWKTWGTESQLWYLSSKGTPLHTLDEGGENVASQVGRVEGED